MKPHTIHRIVLILFAAIFLSCSSNLDFDQVDDFKIEPVFVANVAHFNVVANDIPDDGSGLEIPPDVQNFDVFKNRFLNEHLKKADLDFEIENTANRAFEVDIMFIDENDQTLETISLNVPQYTTGSNIIKYPTEVFEGERLDLLKRTVKVGFAVNIEPGTGNISGNLKLKSGATVYMEIQ